MSLNPTALFIHYLHQLEKMLIKIEIFERSHVEKSQNNMLATRLSDDMLPFISQVRTTINFSLRASCPLAHIELVDFNSKQESFAGLKAQIHDTIDFLTSLSDEQFESNAVVSVQETAGLAQLSLPKEEFLNFYVLPNFFFHLSMVYAIARSCGVPLSKGDYDGYHQYPAGFSFN